MPEIRPAFAQIADHLRKQIEEGVYPPGSSLPSLRTIAKEWKVSQVTASAAVEQLDREGVVLIQGRGLHTVIPDRRLELLRAKALEAAELFRQVADGQVVSADDLHRMADALVALTAK